MERKRGWSDSGNSNKKAQVTLFIIAGIILLFVFAGVLYTVKVVKKTPLLAASEPVLSEVPAEFQPLADYTENCLKQVSTQGLRVLGQQGGYIYPEVVGKYSAADPTDADGILQEPLKVPYWHYNPEPNAAGKVSFRTLQPKLSASEDPEMGMEAQLNRYVEQKLDGCIDEYHAFVPQGFRVDASAGKEVRVKIADESVNFLLNWEVRAQHADASHTFQQFYVKIPLKLKQMYAVANDIAKAERERQFLESQMLSLLGSFASLPDGKLPPEQYMTFEYVGTKFWLTKDVKERLKEIITSYIPLLKLYSAHDFQHYEYPVTDLSHVYQQNYDNMIIPLQGADDVAVRFDYFGWEPYIDVNDNDGLITSENTFTQKWFVAFGTQRYRTTYDISYPVLVALDDPLAFHGEGYQFQFALEANIRNNRRVQDGDVLPPPVTAFQESLACNPDQRSTELVKTVVVDSFTKEPLDLVRIGFTIPDQADCTMGLTNEQGKFESKFPPAYGGVMSFMKEDYLTDFYPIDTYRTKDSTALIGYAVADLQQPAIEMHKMKPVKIAVKKKPLGKCVTPLECVYTVGPTLTTFIPYKDIICQAAQRQCFFQTGLLTPPEHVVRLEANGSLSKYHDYYFIDKEEQLSEDEQALITLTRVSDLNKDLQSASYTAVANVKGKGETEIKLVPGVYQVDGMLMLNKEVIIPSEERSINFDIITWETSTSYNINQSKMDKYLNGRLQWDGQKNYLTITPEDLYTHDQLTFYIPSQEMQDIPNKIPVSELNCAAVICVPGLGCLTNPGRDVLTQGLALWVSQGLLGGCTVETIQTNAKVIEDITMLGKMGNISQDLREKLEPMWS